MADERHTEVLLSFGRTVRVHSRLGAPFKIDAKEGKLIDEAMGHLVDTRRRYQERISECAKVTADLARAQRLVRQYRWIVLCILVTWLVTSWRQVLS